MNNQNKLEAAVNKLIKKYGVQKAVEIIKSYPAKGIFGTMQNYTNGVFIFCHSPQGGVLVGKKD